MKGYTDLEQSKKLAEILPLESADMLILNNVGRSGDVDGTNCHTILKENLNPLVEVPEILPCWSLAALLSVLPNGTDIVKEEADTENEHYMCTVAIKYDIISTFGKNPIDACYQIFIKLHKLKML